MFVFGNRSLVDSGHRNCRVGSICRCSGCCQDADVASSSEVANCTKPLKELWYVRSSPGTVGLLHKCAIIAMAEANGASRK